MFEGAAARDAIAKRFGVDVKPISLGNEHEEAIVRGVQVACELDDPMTQVL